MKFKNILNKKYSVYNAPHTNVYHTKSRRHFNKHCIHAFIIEKSRLWNDMQFNVVEKKKHFWAYIKNIKCYGKLNCTSTNNMYYISFKFKNGFCFWWFLLSFKHLIGIHVIHSSNNNFLGGIAKKFFFVVKSAITFIVVWKKKNHFIELRNTMHSSGHLWTAQYLTFLKFFRVCVVSSQNASLSSISAYSVLAHKLKI